MSKHYWMEVSIGSYDVDGKAETNSGYAAGGQLNLNWTNEEIRNLLNFKIDYLLLQVDHLREIEAQVARKEAEPFWRKWLGA